MAVATAVAQDKVAELQQQGDYAIKSSDVTPQLGGSLMRFQESLLFG
jgi:hypothetical protein